MHSIPPLFSYEGIKLSKVTGNATKIFFHGVARDCNGASNPKEECKVVKGYVPATGDIDCVPIGWNVAAREVEAIDIANLEDPAVMPVLAMNIDVKMGIGDTNPQAFIPLVSNYRINPGECLQYRKGTGWKKVTFPATPA